MNLSDIETIIWDFDGVFYNYDAIPKNAFNDLCYESSAKAACAILKGLDYKTALRLAKKSYEDHKNSTTAFLSLAQQYGITREDLQLELYNKYHKISFKIGTQKYPRLFQPSNDIIQAFHSLDSHITQAILTHSCPEHWTKPISKEMNILQFFNQDNIVGIDSFGFVSKSERADGITLMFNKISANPKTTLFVEDTVKNLQVAKASHPDLRTVLKASSTQTTLPDGVDIMIRNPAELMQNIAKHRQNNIKTPQAIPKPPTGDPQP